MAMLIRDRFELLTLRCWIRTKALDLSSEGSDASVRQVAVSQLFHGEQAITLPVETDLSLLGMPDARETAAPSRCSLAGTEIAGQLVAAKSTAKDGILWFHISRESMPLAVLPWEAMVREITDLVLVRIPNFLENSYHPVADPSIMICASAPILDGPYSLPSYVQGLLDVIENAAVQAGASATVHLFVDHEVQDQIGQLAAGRSSPHMRVELPYETPVSGPRSSSPPDAAIRSPWLQWIADCLEDEVVEIAHFISPGHFDGTGGAIVLANRPDENSRHGDIIDADELIAFYDRLGCAVMGFSSPSMPEWVAGQRALAFELSWLRPGPILLSESSIDPKSALAPAYATLFGGSSPESRDLTRFEPAHLCVHPELLEPPPAQVVEKFGIGETVQEGLPQKKARIAANYVRQRMASLTETRDLTPLESWEREGAREALSFLSSLAGRGE